MKTKKIMLILFIALFLSIASFVIKTNITNAETGNSASVLIYSPQVSSSQEEYAGDLEYIFKNDVKKAMEFESIQVTNIAKTTESSLTGINLYSYDLVVVFLPNKAIPASDIDSMLTYLNAGGRIYIQGENNNYSSVENSYISALITSLGANATITTDTEVLSNESIMNVNSSILNGNALSTNKGLLFENVSNITSTSPYEVIASTKESKYNGIIDIPVSKGRVTLASDMSFYRTTDQTYLKSAYDFFKKLINNSISNKEAVDDGENPNQGIGIFSPVEISYKLDSLLNIEPSFSLHDSLGNKVCDLEKDNTNNVYNATVKNGTYFVYKNLSNIGESVNINYKGSDLTGTKVSKEINFITYTVSITGLNQAYADNVTLRDTNGNIVYKLSNSGNNTYNTVAKKDDNSYIVYINDAPTTYTLSNSSKSATISMYNASYTVKVDDTLKEGIHIILSSDTSNFQLVTDSNGSASVRLFTGKSYTYKIVGTVDDNTSKTVDSAQDISLDYYTVKLFAYSVSGKSYSLDSEPFKTYTVRKNKAIGSLPDYDLLDLAFKFYSESAWEYNGANNSSAVKFDPKTVITKATNLYAHFEDPSLVINGYVRTLSTGELNSTGMYLTTPNVTLLNLNPGRVIESIVISTKGINSITTKNYAKSNVTVTQGNNKKALVNNKATDSEIRIVFENNVTPVEAQDYLRNYLIYEPKLDTAININFFVSSGKLKISNIIYFGDDIFSKYTRITLNKTTGYTLGQAGKTTYYYIEGNTTFTNSNAGGAGLTILGDVTIYIPAGVTLRASGRDASGTTAGGAGIRVTSGNSLSIIGEGSLVAKGGNAANGSNGGNAGNSSASGVTTKPRSVTASIGASGAGGAGGGGAGAGIGGNGGAGGAGGASLSGTSGKVYNDGSLSRIASVAGKNGSAGSAGEAAGVISLDPNITVSIVGGSAGTTGGLSGTRGACNEYEKGYYNRSICSYNFKVGASGGGGGGGSGFDAMNIGSGGSGGSGGGSGGRGGADYAQVIYPRFDLGSSSSSGSGLGGYGYKSGKDGEQKIDVNQNSEGQWTVTGSYGGAGGAAVNSDTSLPTSYTRITSGSSTGKTLSTGNYYITGGTITFTNSNNGGSGLTINGDVVIYIDYNSSLVANGKAGSGTTPGGAGIYVPKGSNLTLIGYGSVTATGGNAGNGSNGKDGSSNAYKSGNYHYLYSYSGAGGAGGGGAGAGIGTPGSSGGDGGEGVTFGGAYEALSEVQTNGINGKAGNDGATVETAGLINIASTLTRSINGGSAGSNGSGGKAGSHSQTQTEAWKTAAGGGGGGGGAGGSGGRAVGAGGAGGGGGGSGSTGSICWGGPNYRPKRATGGLGGTGGYNRAKGNGGSDGASASDENKAEGVGAANSGKGGTGTYQADYFSQLVGERADTRKYSIIFEKTSTTVSYLFEAKEITFPAYTAKDGNVFLGWKLVQAGNYLSGNNTQPLTALSDRLYKAGEKVTITNRTYGDIKFIPVVTESNGIKLENNVSVANSIFKSGGNSAQTAQTAKEYTITLTLDNQPYDFGKVKFVDTTNENNYYYVNSTDIAGVYKLYLGESKTFNVYLGNQKLLVINTPSNQKTSANNTPSLLGSNKSTPKFAGSTPEYIEIDSTNQQVTINFNTVKINVTGATPTSVSLVGANTPTLIPIENQDGTYSYYAYCQEGADTSTYQVSIDDYVLSSSEVKFGQALNVVFSTFNVSVTSNVSDLTVELKKIESGNVVATIALGYQDGSYKSTTNATTGTYTLFINGIKTDKTVNVIASVNTYSIESNFYKIEILTKLNDTATHFGEVKVNGNSTINSLDTGKVEYYTFSSSKVAVTVNNKEVGKITPSTTLGLTTYDFYTVTYTNPTSGITGTITGTLPVDNTYYLKGEKAVIKETVDLELDGMYLAGWKYGNNNYTSVGKQITVNSATTLESLWAVDQVKVEFYDGTTLIAAVNKLPLYEKISTIEDCVVHNDIVYKNTIKGWTSNYDNKTYNTSSYADFTPNDVINNTEFTITDGDYKVIRFVATYQKDYRYGIHFEATLDSSMNPDSTGTIHINPDDSDYVKVNYTVKYNDGVNSIVLIPSFNTSIFEIDTITVLDTVLEDETITAKTSGKYPDDTKILLEGVNLYNSIDEVLVSITYKIKTRLTGEYTFGFVTEYDIDADPELSNDNRSHAYFIDENNTLRDDKQTEVKITVDSSNLHVFINAKGQITIDSSSVSFVYNAHGLTYGHKYVKATSFEEDTTYYIYNELSLEADKFEVTTSVTEDNFDEGEYYTKDDSNNVLYIHNGYYKNTDELTSTYTVKWYDSNNVEIDDAPVNVGTYYIGISASQNTFYSQSDEEKVQITITPFILDLTVVTDRTTATFDDLDHTWELSEFYVSETNLDSYIMEVWDLTDSDTTPYSLTAISDNTWKAKGTHNVKVTASTTNSNFKIETVTEDSHVYDVEIEIMIGANNITGDITNIVRQGTTNQYKKDFDNIGLWHSFTADHNDVIVQYSDDDQATWKTLTDVRTEQEKTDEASPYSSLKNAGVYYVRWYVEATSDYQGVNVGTDPNNATTYNKFDSTKGTIATCTINKLNLKETELNYSEDGKVTWQEVEKYKNGDTIGSFPTDITITYSVDDVAIVAQNIEGIGTVLDLSITPSSTNLPKNNEYYVVKVSPSDTTNYVGYTLNTKNVYTVTFAEGTHAKQEDTAIQDLTADPVTQKEGYEVEYRFAGQKATKPFKMVQGVGDANIEKVILVPTVTGYTFKYWGTQDSTNTIEYDFASEINSNTTITAIWEINKYTIRWLNKSADENEVVLEIDEVEYLESVSYDGDDPTYLEADNSKIWTFREWIYGTTPTDLVLSTYKVTEDVDFLADYTYIWNKFGLIIEVYGPKGTNGANEYLYSINYKLDKTTNPNTDKRILVGTSLTNELTKTVLDGDNEVNVYTIYPWFNLTGLFLNSDFTGTIANMIAPTSDAELKSDETCITLYALYVFDVGTGDVSGNKIVEAPNDVTLYRKWIVGGYDIIEVAPLNEFKIVYGTNGTDATYDSDKQYFLTRVADSNKDLTKDVRDVTTIRMAIASGYGYFVNYNVNVTGQEILDRFYVHNHTELVNHLGDKRLGLANDVTVDTSSYIEIKDDISIDFNNKTLRFTNKGFNVLYDADDDTKNGRLSLVGTGIAQSHGIFAKSLDNPMAVDSTIFIDKGGIWDTAIVESKDDLIDAMNAVIIAKKAQDQVKETDFVHGIATMIEARGYDYKEISTILGEDSLFYYTSNNTGVFTYGKVTDSGISGTMYVNSAITPSVSDISDVNMLFKFVEPSSPTAALTFESSVYLLGSTYEEDINTIYGIDVGNNALINNVTIDKSSVESSGRVILSARTNGQKTLNVNIPNDVMNHYGSAETINITSVYSSAPGVINAYVENGSAKLINIANGAIVFYSTSDVERLHLKKSTKQEEVGDPAVLTDIDYINSVVIGYCSLDNLPIITRDAITVDATQREIVDFKLKALGFWIDKGIIYAQKNENVDTYYIGASKIKDVAVNSDDPNQDIASRVAYLLDDTGYNTVSKVAVNDNISIYKGYKTLNDALTNVSTGDVITLYSDQSISYNGTNPIPYTIDLNNHKLTINSIALDYTYEYLVDDDALTEYLNKTALASVTVTDLTLDSELSKASIADLAEYTLSLGDIVSITKGDSTYKYVALNDTTLLDSDSFTTYVDDNKASFYGIKNESGKYITNINYETVNVNIINGTVDFIDGAAITIDKNQSLTFKNVTITNATLDSASTITSGKIEVLDSENESLFIKQIITNGKIDITNETQVNAIAPLYVVTSRNGVYEVMTEANAISETIIYRSGNSSTATDKVMVDYAQIKSGDDYSIVKVDEDTLFTQGSYAKLSSLSIVESQLSSGVVVYKDDDNYIVKDFDKNETKELIMGSFVYANLKSESNNVKLDSAYALIEDGENTYKVVLSSSVGSMESVKVVRGALSLAITNDKLSINSFVYTVGSEYNVDYSSSTLTSNNTILAGVFSSVPEDLLSKIGFGYVLVKKTVSDVTTYEIIQYTTSITDPIVCGSFANDGTPTIDEDSIKLALGDSNSVVILKNELPTTTMLMKAITIANENYVLRYVSENTYEVASSFELSSIDGITNDKLDKNVVIYQDGQTYYAKLFNSYESFKIMMGSFEAKDIEYLSSLSVSSNYCIILTSENNYKVIAISSLDQSNIVVLGSFTQIVSSDKLFDKSFETFDGTNFVVKFKDGVLAANEYIVGGVYDELSSSVTDNIRTNYVIKKVSDKYHVTVASEVGITNIVYGISATEIVSSVVDSSSTLLVTSDTKYVVVMNSMLPEDGSSLDVTLSKTLYTITNNGGVYTIALK